MKISYDNILLLCVKMDEKFRMFTPKDIGWSSGGDK